MYFSVVLFDYSELKERTWDNEIIAYIAQMHEFKGKQDLYLRQKPVELNRLVEIAKIQSTESSNQIEGIITTNSRLKQLIENKTTPQNRDEQEILGYMWNVVPLDFLAVCGYNHTKSRFSKSKKKAEFYYAFFSESGFDDKIVHDANENETALYNLETIVGFV